MMMDAFECCRGGDYRWLFSNNVKKIDGWLNDRNIRNDCLERRLLEVLSTSKGRPPIQGWATAHGRQRDPPIIGRSKPRPYIPNPSSWCSLRLCVRLVV